MTQKNLPHILLAVFLLFLLSGPGARAASETGRQNQEPGQFRALVYHHVGMEEKFPSTSVSVKQFQKHLAYLKQHDYTVLLLGQALDRLHSEKPLPEKSAVITMDDGYRSIWENALPLLEDYGYGATIFISTRHVGGNNYLTWDQIQKIKEKGFELGNHSHAHAYFLDNPKGKIAKAFEADLKKSHEQFRRHIGQVPDIYSYPFGEYTPGMMGVLKKNGYHAATAQKSGVIYAGSNRFALPRFPMNIHYAGMEGFSEKMRMNALRVAEVTPGLPVVREENPPALKLRIKNNKISSGGLQCFVDGQKNCRMEKTQKNNALIVRLKANNELTSRRTLYTITAPSNDGSQWFWYSHLWVIPEISGDY